MSDSVSFLAHRGDPTGVADRGVASVCNLSPHYRRMNVPLTVRILGRQLRFNLVVNARTIPLVEYFSNDPDSVDHQFLSDDTDGFFTEFWPAQRIKPGVKLEGKFLAYTPYFYERYYVDFGIGFDQFWRLLARDKRQSVQRKMRGIERYVGSSLEFREGRTPAEIRGFFDAIQPVVDRSEKKLWTLNCTEAFIKKSEEVAAQGNLATYIMSVDGQVISYLYCPIVHGSLIYEHLGYDRSWARYSPGFVLLWLVLRSGLARKSGYFDFTRGSGQQKRYFASGKIECGDRYLLRPTVGKKITARTHYWLNRLAYRLEVHRGSSQHQT